MPGRGRVCSPPRCSSPHRACRWPPCGRGARPAAEALAHEHGTAAVGSFDDLLAACDAVAFTVPADVQARLAVTAARAGKHLLLEKPVAFTVAEAQAVADAADDAGVATQMMLTYRFTEQVRAFLSSTAGAPPRYLRTAMLGGGALDGSPFATPWRQAAGAVLFDLGPHTLDLAEAAAGPITELRAAEVGGVVTVSTVHDSGASRSRRDLGDDARRRGPAGSRGRHGHGPRRPRRPDAPPT